MLFNWQSACLAYVKTWDCSLALHKPAMVAHTGNPSPGSEGKGRGSKGPPLLHGVSDQPGLYKTLRPMMSVDPTLPSILVAHLQRWLLRLTNLQAPLPFTFYTQFSVLKYVLNLLLNVIPLAPLGRIPSTSWRVLALTAFLLPFPNTAPDPCCLWFHTLEQKGHSVLPEGILCPPVLIPALIPSLHKSAQLEPQPRGCCPRHGCGSGQRLSDNEKLTVSPDFDLVVISDICSILLRKWQFVPWLLPAFGSLTLSFCSVQWLAWVCS